MNPWIILVTAGLFEMGWPIGLKLGAGIGIWRIVGPVIAVTCMAVSGGLLWLALKHIPIGTAYAVWTGIGAVGTFVIGVVAFGDPAPALRWAGIALIVGGIVCLKLG